MVKVCTLILATVLVVAVVACGSDTEQIAPTPTDAESLAIQEPPSTLVPISTTRQESLPTLTPTPEKNPWLPRSPGKDAPFVPTYSKNARVESVFEMLIPSEQQCVAEAIGADPRELPLMEKLISSYDPYDPLEEQFMDAMFFLCSSEDGHRYRAVNKYVESSASTGLHLTAAEISCIREEINHVPITDGRVELEGKMPLNIYGCVEDSLLLWWVRWVGSEVEGAFPVTLDPAVESCLMDAAIELEVRDWVKKAFVEGEDTTPQELERYETIDSAFRSAAQVCATLSTAPKQFFAPDHSPGTTYGEVFDQLIPAEQKCVLASVVDLDSMRGRIFADHNPDDQAEVRLSESLIFDCPSEEGHRQRSFDDWMLDSRSYGLYTTEEEQVCARSYFSVVPIVDGHIREEAEDWSALLSCVEESALLWYVRLVGSTMEDVHPNSLSPVVEDCLMGLAAELDLLTHIQESFRAGEDYDTEEDERIATEFARAAQERCKSS